MRRQVSAVNGVASHQDAALLWGIELVAVSDDVHVTVAGCRSRCAREGLVVHRADVPAEQCCVRAGVPVTSPLRTVLDLSRTLPLPHAVASADSALRRRLITLTDLTAAVAGVPRGPGRPQCREVLARVDARSGSLLESLARVLFDDAGLRPYETQLVVHTPDGLTARVDIAWPEARLVVELDGFAYHSDREAYRNDRRRMNALLLAGWRVLRFSWEDVVHRPEVVVDQVRRALGA